jgi:UDP-glucose:(heptosyl)LPS alpha-1,3-glucosyltransferase
MALLRQLPLQILIAGDDSPNSFRDTAKSLGIVERCHFSPPSQNVLDFYAAADLYVSPTREDSFGLPVAEAMACALPVITSKEAGIADLILNGTDGFVLNRCDDPQELAQLIACLYGDQTLRSAVANEAAKSALRWTWDQNADAMWEFLQETAAKKRLSSARSRKGTSRG